MKVHVIGSGAREHALRVVLGRTSTIISDPDEADLIVVGPEAPLVAGIADQYRAKGKLVFGPGYEGARLEGSKAYLKDFLFRAGVPTAKYGAFENEERAVAFLQTIAPPYVIKTDGLASGKGVFITESMKEAIDDIRDKLAGTSFGDAGRRVVIEEGMTGPELSLFVLFDGNNGAALPIAQDFKRVGDGDVGPNTGGMGAYSDVGWANGQGFIEEALENIIMPTCTGLQQEGIDYRGVLYAGLICTPDGVKLIEYNVRFGDPEAEVIIPRYGGDLAATLASVAAGKLRLDEPIAIPDQAVTISIASEGYPTRTTSGAVITGVEDAESIDGVMVFQSGVTRNERNELVTTGGRALNVTGLAPTLEEARRKAYEGVGKINFEGMVYRTDIAKKAAELEMEQA